ncbi:hypothetical protein CY35_13G103700 [Sphagnum magellanicum]|nr:hypothetical protein CY35_13G103700 [Sphagnum magellanicum]
MSDSLEFKSRKDLKELCKQFGIRTAGVKHEDLVRVLRTKLHVKDEVTTCRSPRSPSLRGIRNGLSMKDDQLISRIDNHSKSGRKTPRKKLSLSSFEQTPGPTVLRSNGNSARLFAHSSDFLAEEENGDAFSSADMDSLCSLADLPSECCYFDDMIPAYPFEIAAEEFEHDTSMSSKTQNFLEEDHQFGHDIASSKTHVAISNSSCAVASDLLDSLQTAFSDELLSLYTTAPDEELSLFAIPDWVTSTSVVDDPPLLDWEKKLDSDFVAAKGPHISEGNHLGEEAPMIGLAESLGGGGGAAGTVTEEHDAGAEIESTLEQHNAVMSVASSSPAARELGEDSEAQCLPTSSRSSTEDITFDSLGFREEEYVTSDEPFSELSLLPATVTDLVDSILLVEAEEGHHHLPTTESLVDHGLLLVKELQVEEHTDDHTLQPVRLLGTLDDHHTASQVQQQLVETDSRTWQVQQEDEGINFTKRSAAAGDHNAPADAFLQPIDNGLQEAKFVEKEALGTAAADHNAPADTLNPQPIDNCLEAKSVEKEALGSAAADHNTSADTLNLQPLDNSLEAKSVEKEALVSDDMAANSLPMSISENTVGDTTKDHNTAVEIRRETSLGKVGFPLSVILWCAWLCSSCRN